MTFSCVFVFPLMLTCAELELVHLVHVDGDVDAVLANAGFPRIEIEPEVAVVQIERCHIGLFLVAAEVLFELLGVVDFARDHLEPFIQDPVRVDRIPFPGDVPDVVLRTFVHPHQDDTCHSLFSPYQIESERICASRYPFFR